MRNRSVLILSLLAISLTVMANKMQPKVIPDPSHKSCSDSLYIVGRYGIYTGIPKTYIGHFILHEDGTYVVALSSAEEKYASGTYIYHANTKSIEWTGGLFFTNNWKGTCEMSKEGKQKINLNSQTYAVKISN